MEAIFFLFAEKYIFYEIIIGIDKQYQGYVSIAIVL